LLEGYIIENKNLTYAVESIYKSLPNLDIASAFAFIIKAIDPRNICALMIASEEEEILRVFDLVAQQEKNCFQGILASIDVVAKE
jgi:hypothetical protein